MFKPTATGPAVLMAAAALTIAAFNQPAAARTVEIEFDADNFDSPVATEFFPLNPATYVYQAETPDGCEIDIVEVTGETELVAGVTTTVVRDDAYEDQDCDGADPGDLVEKTEDWFQADNSGNVWYFGEETFDCDGADDCTLGAGSWRAGVNGAQPGIVMLADPRSGDRYRQELAEGVAEDWGMVMNLNASVRLRRDDAFPPGEFDGCIVTKEWNALEPGSVEQKSYCPDIGLVLVEEHSGKIVRLELTDPEADDADAFRFRTVPK
ncbi:MAG TPA: hypothetical protein VFU80_08965 [Sphingomicrobium sp.]|nr:hypothetical protein [Sphingomicrobium sp.]